VTEAVKERLDESGAIPSHNLGMISRLAWILLGTPPRKLSAWQ
jgi:hypothetical protein